MRGLSIVLVLACGCARQQAPKPAAAFSSAPKQRTDSALIAETSISGRVILDGQPIRDFGLTITPNASFRFLGFWKPHAIHTEDGRFEISLGPMTSMHADVVIAGAGFARRVIPRVELTGHTTLGTIEVTRGHRFEGVVRNEHGRVVANARVTFDAFRPDPMHMPKPDDELTRLALGLISAMTDVHGRYVIEGAAWDDNEWQEGSSSSQPVRSRRRRVRRSHKDRDDGTARRGRRRQFGRLGRRRTRARRRRATLAPQRRRRRVRIRGGTRQRRPCCSCRSKSRWPSRSASEPRAIGARRRNVRRTPSEPRPLAHLNDINGDGNLDGVARDAILFGRGDGTFASSCCWHGLGPSGDLNGDGLVDMAGSKLLFQRCY